MMSLQPQAISEDVAVEEEQATEPLTAEVAQVRQTKAEDGMATTRSIFMATSAAISCLCGQGLPDRLG